MSKNDKGLNDHAAFDRAEAQRVWKITARRRDDKDRVYEEALESPVVAPRWYDARALGSIALGAPESDIDAVDVTDSYEPACIVALLRAQRAGGVGKIPAVEPSTKELVAEAFRKVFVETSAYAVHLATIRVAIEVQMGPERSQRIAAYLRRELGIDLAAVPPPPPPYQDPFVRPEGQWQPERVGAEGSNGTRT